jgi:hypothetical protein
MKKIGIVLCVVVASALSSCTREFICQCTYSYKGTTPGLPDSVREDFIIKDTKKGAIDKCKRHGITTSTNGIEFNKSCELY